MPVLIVTAHPDPDSLTHAAAARLAARCQDTVETAHLAQEGFDPRFTIEDRRTYQGVAGPGAEVVAEQRRLDRATEVVLVFPVQWWSLPALLKGWIDRVFIAGWAFDVDDTGGIEKRLPWLRAHVLAMSGFSEGSFERHGYRGAFETQLGHGVVDYCGMRRGATAFVHDSESDDRDALTARLDDAVATVAAALADGDSR